MFVHVVYFVAKKSYEADRKMDKQTHRQRLETESETQCLPVKSWMKLQDDIIIIKCRGHCRAAVLINRNMRVFSSVHPSLAAAS